MILFSPLILILWGRGILHDSDVPQREELIPSAAKQKVLAVFHHPDDEVTVAGTVMGLKAAGHEVTLVCLTRGEKGNSANIPTEQELANLRTEEMKLSAQTMGVDLLIQLDYGDGGMDELGLDSLKAVVLALIQTQKPDILLSYDSKVGLYGHSDHLLTGKAVEEVFLAYQGKNGFVPKHLFQVTLSKKQIEIGFQLSAGFQKNYPKDPKKGLPTPDFSVGTQAYFNRTLKVMQSHQTQKKVLQDLMPYHDRVPEWIYSKIFDREYFREVL
ncbi:MAG: PIG-L family deacetylase [Bacteroidetes bacterium]|nr:PIG-L family deacetylase [Bacteroidota bacterium]